MTADERDEYLRIAAGSIADDFDSASLMSDENSEGLTEAQNDALVAMADVLPRAGRDAMLVSMILDSEVGGTDMAVAVLETGWGVCTKVNEGADYGAAFGEAFVDALGAAMASGLETGEDAAAAAEAQATGATVGAMFALLQCPQYADAAFDALSEMGS